VANLVPKFKSPNTSERKTPQSNSLANDEHAAHPHCPSALCPGGQESAASMEKAWVGLECDNAIWAILHMQCS
jgi:hypothetical protein